MRQVIRCGVLGWATVLLGAAMPIDDAQWRPIAADEARLIVLPSAFGTEGIERSVDASLTGVGRQERWRIRFHDAGRFVQIVLRESLPGGPPRPDAVRRLVLDTYPAATASIRWGTDAVVVTGLGAAEVQTFALAGFGCAAFIIRFGAPGQPVQPDDVEGSYCDPATSELPLRDIEATLGAIGVRGVYQP